MFRRVRMTALVACVALGLTSMFGAGGASAKVLGPRRFNQVGGNWAGYVAEKPNITAASGAWTVPNAGTLPPGVSATWVGIGGYGTSDLIQAGTIQDSTPLAGFIDGGQYVAWYELLPDAPTYFTGCAGDPNCTVRPGDKMNVTIRLVGTNSWSIHVGNSRGWTYDTTVAYHSGQASAEWIHEAPSLIAVYIPVGNSGRVAFAGNNTMTVGSSTVNIGHASPAAVALDALPVETTTSALNGAGNAFNVCTYALSCATPAG